MPPGRDPGDTPPLVGRSPWARPRSGRGRRNGGRGRCTKQVATAGTVVPAVALPFFAPSTGYTPPGVRHRWGCPQWEVRSRSHAGNLDLAAGSPRGQPRTSVVASCGAGPEVRAAETPSPCVSTRFTWGPAPRDELATRQVLRTTPAADLLEPAVDGVGDNLGIGREYLLTTLGITCGWGAVRYGKGGADLRRSSDLPVQEKNCRRVSG